MLLDRRHRASPRGPSRSLFAVCALVLAAAGAAVSGGCNERQERAELESTVDYYLQPSAEDRTSRRDFLAALEESPERRIRAALASDALTAAVADRLVSAQNSGIRVEVVTDADARTSNPVGTLRDAGIPVRFGDGQLDYAPDPSLNSILDKCERQPDRRRVVCASEEDSGIDAGEPCGGSEGTNTGTMCRPGSFNRMSQRFVIIDGDIVWNLAGGLRAEDGGPMAWRAESEIIHEDFNREFRQLFGGTFSTTLDAFNGRLKSPGDNNLDYMTDRGVVQMRFNPQERLLKHVIDEVYRAKNSVAIATPTLRNPFLLDALESKAARGFDLSIVVGSSQPQGPARNRLRQLGARQHDGDRRLPTIVVVDGEAADRQWPRTGLVLSHPLFRSRPFTVETVLDGTTERRRSFVYPSDTFVDGTLWKFYEYSSNAGGDDGETDQLDRLETFLEQTFSAAQPL